MKVRLSQATGRPAYGAAAEHIICFLDAAFPGKARSCATRARDYAYVPLQRNPGDLQVVQPGA